jgi:hypothetical protein
MAARIRNLSQEWKKDVLAKQVKEAAEGKAAEEEENDSDFEMLEPSMSASGQSPKPKKQRKTMRLR